MSDYKNLETQRLGKGKTRNNIIFNISVLGSGTPPSTMPLKNCLANPSLGGLTSSPRSTECGNNILTDPEQALAGL